MVAALQDVPSNNDVNHVQSYQLQITRLIAKIDEYCQEFINTILHHPLFQQLESTWRSLHLLAIKIQGEQPIKLRCLNVTWSELERDLSRVVEFSQTEIFNKIYNQEFGMPGGEPYGLLIGDYAIDITSVPHLQCLEMMSNIAAASFVPFIAGTDPKSFGISDFLDFSHIRDIEAIFKSPLYVRWHALRQNENSRFIGLALPQVLLRQPYTKSSKLGIAFNEKTVTKHDYLWGKSNYAFASIVAHSFAESAWFVNLRQYATEDATGGLIDYLPALNFDTDAPGMAYKLNLSVMITDQQERQLSEAGFVPLCQLQQKPQAMFYDNCSIQLPKKYNEDSASFNAKIASSLQYLLCACRFAHYIKIIGRDKMGSFLSYIECENYLNQWLVQYMAGNDDLSPEQKLNYPLRDGKIKIKQNPGRPGHYIGVIYLQPRVHLEQIKSQLVLVTELSPMNK